MVNLRSFIPLLFVPFVVITTTCATETRSPSSSPAQLSTAFEVVPERSTSHHSLQCVPAATKPTTTTRSSSSTSHVICAFKSHGRLDLWLMVMHKRILLTIPYTKSYDEESDDDFDDSEIKRALLTVAGKAQCPRVLSFHLVNASFLLVGCSSSGSTALLLSLTLSDVSREGAFSVTQVRPHILPSSSSTTSFQWLASDSSIVRLVHMCSDGVMIAVRDRSVFVFDLNSSDSPSWLPMGNIPSEIPADNLHIPSKQSCRDGDGGFRFKVSARAFATVLFTSSTVSVTSSSTTSSSGEALCTHTGYPCSAHLSHLFLSQHRLVAFQGYIPHSVMYTDGGCSALWLHAGEIVITHDNTVMSIDSMEPISPPLMLTPFISPACQNISTSPSTLALADVFHILDSASVEVHSEVHDDDGGWSGLTRSLVRLKNEAMLRRAQKRGHHRILQIVVAHHRLRNAVCGVSLLLSPRNESNNLNGSPMLLPQPLVPSPYNVVVIVTVAIMSFTLCYVLLDHVLPQVPGVI